MPTKLVIDWRGRAIEIEIAWVGLTDPAAEVMVFLHEGLGSVALWKDFPDRLCRQLGLRGLVYSRPGYGASTPRGVDEHWGVNFMHQQATEVLPALLAQLQIPRPWLFGHSDGGSIALLYAAHYAEQVRGVIVVAPHIMVEAISITSITAAREAYLDQSQPQSLRERLAAYHQDVDSAFFGWNDIWLSPAFRSWCIEDELAQITCPLLAIQGAEDEYGSMQQVLGIRDRLPATEVLTIANCGHSPHRQQTDLLMKAVEAFVSKVKN